MSAGAKQKTFVFEPGRFQGKAELVLAGSEIDRKTSGRIALAHKTDAPMLASATWQYVTDRADAGAAGDLFTLERRHFKIARDGKGETAAPLGEGAAVAVGDEVEVRLTLTAKHPAEYVHLRDPRGAGFEPVTQRSGWRYDGVARYEEIRDSAVNHFIERLPQGRYELVYRVRAATAGKFRLAPAVVQSLYAPEFAAHSASRAFEVTR